MRAIIGHLGRLGQRPDVGGRPRGGRQSSGMVAGWRHSCRDARDGGAKRWLAAPQVNPFISRFFTFQTLKDPLCGRQLAGFPQLGQVPKQHAVGMLKGGGPPACCRRWRRTRSRQIHTHPNIGNRRKNFNGKFHPVSFSCAIPDAVDINNRHDCNPAATLVALRLRYAWRAGRFQGASRRWPLGNGCRNGLKRGGAMWDLAMNRRRDGKHWIEQTT